MKLKLRSMPPINPGNVFEQDPYHMGNRMGTDIMMMYATHPTEVLKYLVFINTATGERWKLSFEQEETAL